FYRGMRDEHCTFMKPGTKIEVPTGIAVYPKELIPFPPRSIVEKGYNIARWTEFDRGGHFAAFETQDVFADDLAAFVRQVKSSA
ncbi:MAG: epoxide hydrolase, partial [Rhodospirillaceae bacterium]